MKSLFPGYYPLSDEQYKLLWKEAIIVPDTNVLLNLYRYPERAREDFLNALNLLRDRLWIPHQVALEFQRNRLKVIEAAWSLSGNEQAKSSEQLSSIVAGFQKLEIEKRSKSIDVDKILSDLRVAHARLVDSIVEIHRSQLEVSSSDPIRDRIDDLLYGSIGEGPKTQQELDSLTEGGEDRYSKEIPPGYHDADKEKNPKFAEFIHNHLVYKAKFGDLILWRQIINHAKGRNIKHLIIVTGDQKPDWWWREHGKTMGPHQELVSEILRNTPVELFWMYSSDQFLANAHKQLNAPIADQSVQQVQQVQLVESEHDRIEAANRLFENSATLTSYLGLDDIEPVRYPMSQITRIVQNWLSSQFGEVIEISKGIQKRLLAHRGDGLETFDVIRLSSLNTGVLMEKIKYSNWEQDEIILDDEDFKRTLIVVLGQEPQNALFSNNRGRRFLNHLQELVNNSKIETVLIGTIVKQEFELILRIHRDTQRP
ncbi:PIN-like domain-containing protein [Pseudorhodoferax sp. Leaf274]|uniref:PIN-like domain-containing protein n=1 Tax=Pseudorhodoferax sp. Leaf274 TaxID=1736318 RepID=UPI000AA91DA4|nr:PIN-like domain-containing protein [Pseudorhodoferax sp. Leaf274]